MTSPPQARESGLAAPRSAFAGSIAPMVPGRVVGRLAVELSHCDAAGAVHAGTLFGLAAETARSGAQAEAGQDCAPRLIEAKSVLLAPGPARYLTAEARRLTGAPGVAVWTVDIHEEAGRTLATICHSFLSEPVTPPAPAAASPAAPAAGDPSGSNPPSLGDRRRERIALAAGDVIARKGFANATMREIAEAAGLHVPTMYQHVDGKDEVLELFYAQAMERISRELDARLVTAQGAADGLRQMMSALLDVVDGRRHDVGVLNREFKSLQPEARARVIAGYRALIQRFADRIAQGIASGEFRKVDPFIAANFAEMLCDVWALRPFFLAGYPVGIYRREALDFMLYGLSPRPPA